MGFLVYNLGPLDMQKLYEEWLQSNEKWSSSSYVIQLQQSSEHVKMGARRWMTFKEISSKYSSDEIATCSVEEKKANPVLREQSIKRHPDCPSRDDAKLHLKTFISCMLLGILSGFFESTNNNL